MDDQVGAAHFLGGARVEEPLVVDADAEIHGRILRPRIQVAPSTCYVSSARMPHQSACEVCGHPVFDAKNHDVPAPRAAKMFPTMTCKCGKPARVRCFNGVGTYWTECEDGHGQGRPA